MGKVVERFAKYMEIKDLNPNKVTNEANLSVGVIGKAMKNSSDFSIETVEKILSTYTDLDANWLLTGNGEMIKSQSDITLGENSNLQKGNNNVHCDLKIVKEIIDGLTDKYTQQLRVKDSQIEKLLNILDKK
ncbi:MAG: hypothetical protein II956_13395 [Bacteroidales bacterium]|nr:hypothetical protein [Bacteroidales bacterium]